MGSPLLSRRKASPLFRRIFWPFYPASHIEDNDGLVLIRNRLQSLSSSLFSIVPSFFSNLVLPVGLPVEVEVAPLGTQQGARLPRGACHLLATTVPRFRQPRSLKQCTYSRRTCSSRECRTGRCEAPVCLCRFLETRHRGSTLLQISAAMSCAIARLATIFLIFNHMRLDQGSCPFPCIQSALLNQSATRMP